MIIRGMERNIEDDDKGDGKMTNDSPHRSTLAMGTYVIFENVF